jgi:hypothetical protein
MSYEGSCHCGEVKFEVAGPPPTKANSCNCSHCSRKGFLLTFAPATDVTITSGEETLKTYTFNKHKLKHRFCRTCGVQPLAEGSGPDGTEMRAVNLRCVPSIDLDSLEINRIDGAAF